MKTIMFRSVKTCAKWNEFTAKWNGVKPPKKTDANYQEYMDDLKETTIAVGKHTGTTPLL